MNTDSKQTSARENAAQKTLWYVLAVVVMAVIAWLFFMPSVTEDMVLQQNDVVQGLANGHEISQYRDATGEKSWWTDALFGGMPTFQISPSYESSSWLKWVQSIYTLGFPQPVNWLFMLMIGFFIFLIACDCKWYVALLGAIAYAFSSYFLIIIHAGHIWKVLTLAYIPPTLGGIVLAYRGKYLAGAALAALFGALQLMSNHVQMSYYAAFIIAALVVGYLIKAVQEKKFAQWGLATASLLVAALLAVAANAPNLYMTYKYSKETMRGGHSELTPQPAAEGEDAPKETPTPSGLTKEYITQWSYGLDETMTLIVPNAKGGTSEKTLYDLDEAGEANIGDISDQALQIFPQYFGDQPFTSGPVYVGILIFWLFLLGCVIVKGPVKWALLVVTVLTVMLSWGHNFMGLTDFFIDHFPMYNKFRTVSSILVVAEITMPLLAALAVGELLKMKKVEKETRLALLATAGVTAVLCLALALAPGMMGGKLLSTDVARFGQATQGQMDLADYPMLKKAVIDLRQGLVSSDAWRSLFILVLGAGATVLFMSADEKKRKAKAALPLVLAALTLIDLFAVDRRYLNEDDFVEAESLEEASLQPTAADLQIMKDKSHYRVFDIPGFSSPRSSYFHNTVGGYHAAKLSRYNDLIERQLYNNNLAVLNMLNTKYVIQNENTVMPNPDALGNAWFVDTLTYVDNADKEMAFLDKFNPATTAVADESFKTSLGEAVATAAGDTIYLTDYKPNALAYQSHSAGDRVAVFSEVYFPWGWDVTIDGKPATLGRVNYVLRALRVPAGDHKIAFSFKPKEVSTTDLYAKAAIVVIFLLLAIAATLAFRRRKPSVASADDETKKVIPKEKI